jgi:sugar phosphate isomerase/epimerase
MRHVAHDFGALVRATEASGYRGIYSIEQWPTTGSAPPADPIRAALALKDELRTNLRT